MVSDVQKMVRGTGEKSASHTPQMAGLLAIGLPAFRTERIHTHTSALKAAVLSPQPGTTTIHTETHAMGPPQHRHSMCVWWWGARMEGMETFGGNSEALWSHICKESLLLSFRASCNTARDNYVNAGPAAATWCVINDH